MVTYRLRRIRMATLVATFISLCRLRQLSTSTFLVPLRTTSSTAKGRTMLHSDAKPVGVAKRISVSAVATDYIAAAEAASASAPAILTVIAAAATSSILQLSRDLPGSEDSSSKEAGFFGPQRWVGRTVGIGLTWILLASYAFLLAPGNTPEAKEADVALLQNILSTPFDGSVPPLFVCIFNMLGIWPAVYAATLLPGADKQSPVPAWPFVASSFALGAFGLSPYLAVREYRGSAGVSGSVDWFTANCLESRITALLLFAGAVYLALYAIGNGTIGAVALTEAWNAFLPVFMGSLTPHVSCIDFMVLWMFYSPVLLEDGRRRGCFLGSPSSWSSGDAVRFAFCAGVPVFGGVTWMLTRPVIPEQK